MFGISKLSAAVRALADNLTALAGTVAEVNSGLRHQLALDGPEPTVGPRAAEVIDHAPAGQPEALPGPRRGRTAEANHGPAKAAGKIPAAFPNGGAAGPGR
jgi:hypothetical protein